MVVKKKKKAAARKMSEREWRSWILDMIIQLVLVLFGIALLWLSIRSFVAALDVLNTGSISAVGDGIMLIVYILIYSVGGLICAIVLFRKRADIGASIWRNILLVAHIVTLLLYAVVAFLSFLSTVFCLL